MKSVIQAILKLLSKLILAKYRPEIIGITGSVGKTSAKFAIKTVLEKNFRVRASKGNYNTEIGVPLSIIGAENPYKSIFGWLGVFLRALKLIVKKDKNYPSILVLEMAADHPGDIKYLVKFARPKVGVITSVNTAHLEFFKTIDNILEEKSKIISHLKSEGCAVLNNDDVLVKSLKEKTIANVMSYGMSEDSKIRAVDIVVDKEKGGLSFKMFYNGSYIPVYLPNILGKPGVYSVLAAVTVGIFYKMNLVQIAESLKNIRPFSGRLNLIPGIKNTKIIDDSYNSSPIAVKVALEILSHLNCTGEKWAVLGDMLELGNYTEKAHKEIGELVAQLGIDYLVTVGECSIDTNKAAQEYGMNLDRIFNFDTSQEAGKFMQDKMQEGDLLLIKGSEGMRMEKIVKEIMAEPGKAGEILVRQKGIWISK